MLSFSVSDVHKLRFRFQLGFLALELQEGLTSASLHLALHQKAGNKLCSEISQPYEPQVHMCRYMCL